MTRTYPLWTRRGRRSARPDRQRHETIGRMRSPSRDEAPARPAAASASTRACTGTPARRVARALEAGWATDPHDDGAGRVPGDGARGGRKEAAREAAVARPVAAAGKCPTSLPPPKLNQSARRPRSKRKPSRLALWRPPRCPTVCRRRARPPTLRPRPTRPQNRAGRTGRRRRVGRRATRRRPPI